MEKSVTAFSLMESADTSNSEPLLKNPPMTQFQDSFYVFE